MPPAQCPECGRFLSKDFVSSLTQDGTPCPSCQHTLLPADFGMRAPRPDVAREGAAVEEQSDPDPLAGWDQGRVVALDDGLAGPSPGPSDAAVIGIAALVGALIGLLLGRPRRFAAMLFGAVLGAGVGAASRRVWELPDDAAT